ncbi:MAG: hypothetical protein ABJZ55_14490 [Fuerstiella sp.]
MCTKTIPAQELTNSGLVSVWLFPGDVFFVDKKVGESALIRLDDGPEGKRFIFCSPFEASVDALVYYSELEPRQTVEDMSIDECLLRLRRGLGRSTLRTHGHLELVKKLLQSDRHQRAIGWLVVRASLEQSKPVRESMINEVSRRLPDELFVKRAAAINALRSEDFHRARRLLPAERQSEATDALVRGIIHFESKHMDAAVEQFALARRLALAPYKGAARNSLNGSAHIGRNKLTHAILFNSSLGLARVAFANGDLGNAGERYQFTLGAVFGGGTDSSDLRNTFYESCWNTVLMNRPLSNSTDSVDTIVRNEDGLLARLTLRDRILNAALRFRDGGAWALDKDIFVSDPKRVALESNVSQEASRQLEKKNGAIKPAGDREFPWSISQSVIDRWPLLDGALLYRPDDIRLQER